MESTPGTVGTDGTAIGTPSLAERIETLTDAIGTANRAAIQHRKELEALRMVIIFALVVGGAFFIAQRKGD